MGIFRCPTYDGGPDGDHRLFWFGPPRQVGFTVLKYGSTYVQVKVASPDEVDAADRVYLGGYEHVVDNAEAALLTAAGYTVV